MRSDLVLKVFQEIHTNVSVVEDPITDIIF